MSSQRTKKLFLGTEPIHEYQNQTTKRQATMEPCHGSTLAGLTPKFPLPDISLAHMDGCESCWHPRLCFCSRTANKRGRRFRCIAGKWVSGKSGIDRLSAQSCALSNICCPHFAPVVQRLLGRVTPIYSQARSFGRRRCGWRRRSRRCCRSNRRGGCN